MKKKALERGVQWADMVADAGADWTACALCGARLKRPNLERHYAQTHPGQKPQMGRVPRAPGADPRVLLAFTGVYALVAGTLILLLFLLRSGGLNMRTDVFLGFFLLVLVVALGMTLGAEK